MVDVEAQVVGPQEPPTGAQVGAEVGVAQGGAGGRRGGRRGRGPFRPRQGCLRPGQRPAHLQEKESPLVLMGAWMHRELRQGGKVEALGEDWEYWEGTRGH